MICVVSDKKKRDYNRTDIRRVPLIFQEVCCIITRSPHIDPASVAAAIAIAPSRVLCPPMNPALWQNLQFAMPEAADSSASRSPRQDSGSDSLKERVSS